MKRFLYASLILLICLTVKAQTIPEGIAAEANVPEAKYPRVLHDGRAVFSIYAPEARKV